MSQLSLFPDKPAGAAPDQKLLYKVRCSNVSKRISQDKIFTFASQEEAQKKLDEWIKKQSGNDGYIYRETIAEAFLRQYKPEAQAGLIS